MMKQANGRWPLRQRAALACAGLITVLGVALAGCSNAGSPTAPEPIVGVPTTTGSPAAAASGSTATASTDNLTQQSEGGQVTVAVTWQGKSAGPIFTVSMNTHSVDLDSYDLRQNAILLVDQGREVKPTDWDAPKGGHHRSGTLTFPATAPDGKPVIGVSARTIDLVIRDVAGVPERTFRWDL